MTNGANKTSNLSVTTSLSANDRVIVIKEANGRFHTRTIQLGNFVANAAPVANSSKAGVVSVGENISHANGVISIPIANTEIAGVIKVGNNLSVNASGFLNAEAGGDGDTIQVRRDTRENWEKANPILSEGEPGLEKDTLMEKVGDGVTPWNDLQYAGTMSSRAIFADGGKWGVETLTGTKEFTFTTRGHIWIETTSTVDGNVTSYPVSLELHSDIVKAFDAKALSSSVYLMINGDYAGKVSVSSITFDGDDTYNLIVPETAIALNDRVQVMAWVKGTQLIYNNIFDMFGLRAVSPTTNSNQVIIALDEDQEDWDKLIANPTKSSIVFDDKPVAWVTDGQHLIDDSRKILSVVQSGSNFTVTFDGSPISLRTDYNTTVEAKAALATDNAPYVIVSRTSYPELSDYVYYSGGTVTIGETTVNISSVDKYSGGDLSYYGDNWYINLDGNVTVARDGDITFSYNKNGTDITLEVYEPNVNEEENSYMWFNWKDDMPAFKNGEARGIEGGEITFFTKIYRPYDNTIDYYMNAKYFHMNHMWDYARRSGQPNFWFGRDQNSTLFYDFDEDGIVFKEYPYENVSQDIKVRIAYQMRLFIGDTEDD